MMVETDIPIPMRDGVVLKADVYRPDGEQRRPTLLHRTPYDKYEQFSTGSLEGPRLVQAGFNVVIQDIRGRFRSEGVFTPYIHEADDGLDTIAWASSQPWSLPAVGMIGRSYSGALQWMANCAEESSTHLRAIAPETASASFYESWTYQGGAFQLGFCLRWVLENFMSSSQSQPTPGGSEHWLAQLHEAYEAPWKQLDLLDTQAPYYREWLQHPSFDDYWRNVCSRRNLARMAAPALIVTGWYDTFLAGAIADFKRIQAIADSNTAARRSRLIVGPWSHLSRTGIFAQRDFGADARLDLTGLYQKWFHAHLSDLAHADDSPRVRLFVMGVDEWRSFDDFPPADCRLQRWYLRNDGMLAADPPQDERVDSYVYDPRDPVPTVPDGTLRAQWPDDAELGPLDQRSTELRPDVLCYTTTPLQAPLTVIGEITMVLFASASTLDTDFVARVIDVWPGGEAMRVCDGILRARYRDGLAEPRLLEPDAAYRFEFRLQATGMVFGSGHRIRLELSSSSVPQFDPNSNTGGPSLALSPGATVPARVTVFHTRSQESHLILPCIDAGSHAN